MSNEQQRHDSRDQVWNLLAPHRSGQRGQWGVAQHKITGGLSMAYFGFYTQEHMAGVAAVLREMGYCISAFSQMSLIWNGR